MLPEFIRKSDQLGGETSLACQKYWMHMSYRPTVHIDTTLHPTSKEYYQQQMDLYKELTTHTYEANINEDNKFDLKKYIAAPTPYFDRDPHYINNHMYGMSLFMKLIPSPEKKKILEMGCGWGFCCEYLARLGHEVTGVDINRLYIQGATKRKQKAKLNIKYITSSFENFKTTDTFDMVFFYEAFHHSADPLSILTKLRRHLKKNGVFVIIAEPFIDSTNWSHWGLRLDPLAVYTIRKKGWFESGWTISYMKSLYREVGLKTSYIDYPDSDITHYLIGKPSQNFEATQFDLWNKKDYGWYDENEYLVSSGKSYLEFDLPHSIKKLRLCIKNLSNKKIQVTIKVPFFQKKVDLTPGGNIIELPIKRNRHKNFFMKFDTSWWDVWVPHDIYGNNDKREISFHLKEIEYIH
jgi:2-polyprenyl-3-methyl-5-hydroxy-6-metoxy-1,4-benzoquinol methylase